LLFVDSQLCNLSNLSCIVQNTWSVADFQASVSFARWNMAVGIAITVLNQISKAPPHHLIMSCVIQLVSVVQSSFLFCCVAILSVAIHTLPNPLARPPTIFTGISAVSNVFLGKLAIVFAEPPLIHKLLNCLSHVLLFLSK